MRRKERALEEAESIKILNKAEYGVLSTSSIKGEPYGIPLNFCYLDHSIYFHCAVEGHKLDNINVNKLVSFCVVGTTEVLPDSFGTKYESVIISGHAEEVLDQEKQKALEALLHKYCAGYIEEGKKYIETMKSKTKVLKLRVISLSGKARRK